MMKTGLLLCRTRCLSRAFRATVIRRPTHASIPLAEALHVPSLTG